MAARPESSGKEWDAFLEKQPHASFYHCYGWKRLNQEKFGHTPVFLEARDGDVLTGVLPLVLTKSHIFGRILCSMPFVNFGGPIAIDGETTQRLIEAAKEQAAQLGADYLELRCDRPLDTDIPASLHKISMALQLDADPDALWTKFTSKHRTQVRRVYKDGVAVLSGGREQLPAFYSVMQQSFRDLGTPLYAPEFFAAILDAFPDETRIFVCHRNGEPVAVAFNGYCSGVVEGMWAGTTQLGHDLQANYVLYWEMIKDACERGFRRYHFGRSTVGSGGEQFKKKWNAEPAQLYWYYHRPRGDHKAVVNVDNPKYKLAIATWRKLPLWATRVLGPPLARVIP